MAVIRIGEGQFSEEGWTVKNKKEIYSMHHRLIDERDEVKQFRSRSHKKPVLNHRAPNYDKARKTFYEERRENENQWLEILRSIYQEIKEESSQRPILLKVLKDYQRRASWNCCLYQGIIYQFDHSDYSDGEMIEQIEALGKGSK